MFDIVSICEGGGYRYCKTEPPHPKRNSNDLYPLHRVLMENKLGRLLDDKEVVHHIDEDKRNDIIENLEVLTNSEHSRLHALARGGTDTIICAFCKEDFYLPRHLARQRLRRCKGGLCCSIKCAHALRADEVIIPTRPLDHGTVEAYGRYNCRCSVCKFMQYTRTKQRLAGIYQRSGLSVS